MFTFHDWAILRLEEVLDKIPGYNEDCSYSDKKFRHLDFKSSISTRLKTRMADRLVGGTLQTLGREVT